MGKVNNSRYGGYWKPEKVFFNESVSTILQLVVAHWPVDPTEIVHLNRN